MNTFSDSELDFTAIDFETANSSHASACAVGLAKVRGGAVVETVSWLIAPPAGVDTFSRWNVDVHGITAEMVVGAPTWEEVFPEVMSLVGEDALVAHNAPFDRSVFRQTSGAFDLEAPATDWYDTLPIARRLLTLGSYSLPFVAHELELDQLTHHQAETDATQAARIMIALGGRAGAAALEDFAIPVGNSLTAGRAGTRPHRDGDGTRAPGDFSALEATDVLSGENIVFTGTLSLHARDEAQALVEHFGGAWQKSVTKATTIVVSGDLDSRTFRPGATLTRKLQRAMELAKKGQPLEIWTERELHERLDIGREALEAATREQRAVARSGWLPQYVVDQARVLEDEELGYTTWLRRALRHPSGRPGSEDRCLRCDREFRPDVYWSFLERWMCSPECNEGLKRSAKKVWSDLGISRPAAPTYAESWGRS